MILVLSHIHAASRNIEEAKKRGCNWLNAKYWSEIRNTDFTALRVGNGEGLTTEELAKCEDEPESFDGYIPLRFRGIEKVTVTDYFSESYCDVLAEINGVKQEFKGYFYKNDYWDNYTVLEWIAEQLKA